MILRLLKSLKRMPNYKYTAAFDFEVNACEEIAGINIAKANIEKLKIINTYISRSKKEYRFNGCSF